MTTSPHTWKHCSLSLTPTPLHPCLEGQTHSHNGTIKRCGVRPTRFRYLGGKKHSFSFVLLCWSGFAHPTLLLSRALRTEVQTNIPDIPKIRLSSEAVGHRTHPSWTDEPSSHRGSRKVQGRQTVTDGGLHFIFLFLNLGTPMITLCLSKCMYTI